MHRCRDGAVPVDPASRQLHQVLLGGAIGCLAVGGDLFIVFGDPIARDKGRDRQVDLGVFDGGDVLTLDLGEGFLQHLHVEVEANGLHLAALLHPQQIAHAADLHIAHGQLIAAAELGEFLDGPKPLAGRF